jgi:hypothetical protein
MISILTFGLGLFILMLGACEDGTERVENTELKSSASIYFDPFYEKIEIKVINTNNNLYKYSFESEEKEKLISREVKKGNTERVKCKLYSDEGTFISYDCDIALNGKNIDKINLLLNKGVKYTLYTLDNNESNATLKSNDSILIPE